ncbi:MAG: hypothetical protein HY278_06200 [candidate division NC10 bacterium]|nr:hypothetical protein [candidate division NC10 bacterium]
MNTSRHQTAGIKFVLLIVLAFGLCMLICDIADHHGSSAAHPFLCAIAMPQVFQLLVLMNSLFLAILTGIGVPLAPTFSLLKPPRFVPL